MTQTRRRALYTSAFSTNALPKGPSIAETAALLDGVGGSDVTTAAGVNVVAALADTGTLAARRLVLKRAARALKG